MNNNYNNNKKKHYLTIKKEIRQQNKTSYVFTLPYQFFKILKCYNKKKLFFNIRIDKNLCLYCFLSVNKPIITPGLIYTNSVKLQYTHSGIKSPKINIPLFLINFLNMHKITQKNIITITDKPTFINDIEQQKILNLFFE